MTASACPAPSGRRSARWTWSPLQAVCTPHTSPCPNPKPGDPAVSRRVESCPVRPRREARMRVPMERSCRWGARSRHQRPVRSRTSAASRGRGMVTRRVSRVHGAPAVLVTVLRARTSPEASSLSSQRSSSPSVTARTVTVPPVPLPPSGAAPSRGSTSTDRTVHAGKVTRPSWCPAIPGWPRHPSPWVGTRETQVGTSTPLWAAGGAEAAAIPVSSGRSAPQCRTWGSPSSGTPTTSAVPAAFRRMVRYVIPCSLPGSVRPRSGVAARRTRPVWAGRR